jgi:DNA polymerase III epsilon subunit-like protein
MYLVTDVETTKFYNFALPADHPDQARIASVGFIVADDDFEPLSESEMLVKPTGWELTDEAASVNGLTMDRLYAEGRPIEQILSTYTRHIKAGLVVVAHNAQFECKAYRGELRRARLPDLFEETKNICTMRACNGVVKATQAGTKRRKFPTLQESYAHFYKRPFEFPHTALGDARAVCQVARFLKQINCLPEPKVHYAGEGTKAGAALAARREAESTEETMPVTHLPEDPI